VGPKLTSQKAITSQGRGVFSELGRKASPSETALLPTGSIVQVKPDQWFLTVLVIIPLKFN
jgi:hypothetical protein